MSTELSPENEEYLRQVVAAGSFPDRSHALDEAVGLLRSRQALLAHIDEGVEQLQRGDFVEHDQESLRRFFDEVQAQGRARYEASRVHP
jgi:Arc/MetJ-type ribon-helix-helix transcriptional regulator